jgi:hypothetical protein
MDVKTLDLTERDFQLLVEALDYLPEKGSTGDLLSNMIGHMLINDEDKRAEFDAKMKAEQLKRQKERDALKEDIRILQGKLLLFKRYLIEQDALRQTREILNQ